MAFILQITLFFVFMYGVERFYEWIGLKKFVSSKIIVIFTKAKAKKFAKKWKTNQNGSKAKKK